jgi:hypothetical protein
MILIRHHGSLPGMLARSIDALHASYQRPTCKLSTPYMQARSLHRRPTCKLSTPYMQARSLHRRPTCKGATQHTTHNTHVKPRVVKKKTLAAFRRLRFVSFRFVSFRFVSFRFVSFRFVSFRFVSFRFVSFRFVSFRFVSFRFGSVRFVSVRFVSVRFGSFRFASLPARLLSCPTPRQERRGGKRAPSSPAFNLRLALSLSALRSHCCTSVTAPTHPRPLAPFPALRRLRRRRLRHPSACCEQAATGRRARQECSKMAHTGTRSVCVCVCVCV